MFIDNNVHSFTSNDKGVIYNVDSSLINTVDSTFSFKKSTFSDMNIGGDGGVLYLANIEVDKVSFEDCSITNLTTSRGGLLFAEKAQLTIFINSSAKTEEQELSNFFKIKAIKGGSMIFSQDNDIAITIENT